MHPGHGKVPKNARKKTHTTKTELLFCRFLYVIIQSLMFSHFPHLMKWVSPIQIQLITELLAVYLNLDIQRSQLCCRSWSILFKHTKKLMLITITETSTQVCSDTNKISSFCFCPKHCDETFIIPLFTSFTSFKDQSKAISVVDRWAQKHYYK